MAVKTRKRKSLKHIRKLSTLLALGLRDLRKQERGKNCVVDMSNWWLPRSKQFQVCHTCLAGSVMKYGLVRPRKTAGDEDLDPYDYDRETNDRLHALNMLRVGYVTGAAAQMESATSLRDRGDRVPDYHADRDGWWAAMKRLLADLKAAGE